MRQSRCRPAVPLETAAAYGAPTRSANSSSKRSIVGPSDSRPERSTSRTSSSSRSSRYGLESGTRRVPVLLTPAAGAARRRTRASAPSAPRRRGTVSRYAFWISSVTGPTPDLVVVDRADRRHLGGRAGHEDLVGEVEIGADQRASRRRRSRGRCAIWMTVSRVIPGRIEVESVGRVDRPVPDDEDVLARAVGDEALGGEQDRLVVAGAVRLGAPRASS